MPFSTYVGYPHKAGSRFDFDYYTKKHFVIVDKLWRPLGLQSWSVTSFQGDEAAPYLILTQLIWDDAASAAKAYGGPGFDEIAADVPAFTDLSLVHFKGEQIAKST